MEGVDVPVARQGDGDDVRRVAEHVARAHGARAHGARAHVDSATVVIDPKLPDATREALVRAGRKLVPFQGPVPVPASPAGNVRGCAFVAGLFFILSIVSAGTGSGSVAYVMLMFAGTGLLMSLLGRPNAKEVEAAHVPVTEHRHYVQPSTDIDAEHWKLWKRAVEARNRIARADVVNAGQIDSVQVAEVLPQRLWDIADQLARLAELRARHREILGDVSPDDPDVAPAVTRQRRVQELALADATRRVRNLENFADLLDTADLAARKELIVRELNALDDTHAQLLAGIGDTALDVNLAHRLADDATAVIEQARQAIASANEAALTLALPGDEPASEEPAGTGPADAGPASEDEDAP
jgi:hypothetical protein